MPWVIVINLTGMARGSLGCYNIDNSTDAPVLKHSPLQAFTYC